MEQKFRITGTLYSKSATREVGAKNYPIREFVIHIPNRENPNYDEYIPFQLKGKNFVDKIDGFEKNSFLTVEAVPSGRMWVDPKGNEKFFPSLNAIFISSENEMTAPQNHEELTPFPELDKIEENKAPIKLPRFDEDKAPF